MDDNFITLPHSSYYKVVVFIVPLQGLYAILLEILWIVYLERGYNRKEYLWL